MPTFLLGLDVTEQVIDCRDKVAVGTQDFAGVVKSDLGSIQYAMGFRESPDIIGCEIVSFQSNYINTARSCRYAVDQHVGRYIVQHTTQAADETVAANRGKVMDGRSAREGCTIVYVYVAAQQRGVGHDDPVADTTVMGNV